MPKVLDEIDVIAQFKHDGCIIPMRIQMINAAGKPEAFTIKGYRQIIKKGTYTTVDDIFVTYSTVVFECQITMDDKLQVVRLYYQPEGHLWLLGMDE